MNDGQNLVMVGNGPTGILALEELLRQAPRRYRITVIGEETHLLHNPILLDAVARYQGSVAATQLGVTGIDLYVTGRIPDHADGRVLVLADPDAGVYRRIDLMEGRVVAATLLGDTTDGPWYRDLIAAGTDVSRATDLLLFGRRYAQARLRVARRQHTGSTRMDKLSESGLRPDKRRLLVVGNGMVGHHFLSRGVESSAFNDFQVTILGEEPRPAYDRVHLSEYFAGRTEEDLCLVPKDFYAEHGIEARFADPVVRIDRAAKQAITASGASLPYDKLVLATGSYPFVPPVPGRDRPRCYVYRTIEDLEAITEGARDSRRGVVIGGGLLGLEAANALRHLGLVTEVVEFAPQLMGVQLDAGGGAMLRRKIEALGLVVHTGKNTREIVAGTNSTHRLNFTDGDGLDTDLVVFSAGIRPRDELAKQADLITGERGGVVIDDQCRTSDPDIYAIGECALWGGRIFGLVAPGYRMAKVAVDHLTGKENAFTGADMSTKLKLLGVEVGSIGDAHGKTAGALSYVYQDERQQTYKRLVVSADGKQLLGAVLLGDTADYGTLLQYCLNATPLPERAETLILPDTGGLSKPALGPLALPDAAQICACHDVSKAAICALIDQGCTDLAGIKVSTKASTGCGGCGPLLKSLLESELAGRGQAINTDLCEHFPHTRQELYHLVRVGDIHTFSTLLAKHGRGRGCDVCKPAVTSILASCWNDYVLKPQHVPLQDTNDRSLANLQKDGTYSVIPRVPGGEIPPDKLIVLGEVANEFGLYAKITGGQRVDLLGARLEQLPAIWTRLVDAGFESGHAYAKALRTVKSCVGSTWCRYGVDDSVGLAIALEHRYKGLRAPHKLKLAVSGCTRECAEAQSKDVGVIATENGWNLYVCGNGGMRPRHADLLATNLDRVTLVRSIDRFLMFYARTADRLQRTSVWLEKLEGGLDYLRALVMDDKLGIGAELEAQMAQVINSYECEWKRTLEDPVALARFRPFVNSDTPDEQVVHVLQRGQPRPATVAERRRAVATEPA